MTDTEALRAAFDQFDLNGDGMISAAEFRSVMAELGGAVLSESEAQAILDVADTNKDGMMTWEEFAALQH